MNIFILKITSYITTRYFKSFKNLGRNLITYFKKKKFKNLVKLFLYLIVVFKCIIPNHFIVKNTI